MCSCRSTTSYFQTLRTTSLVTEESEEVKSLASSDAVVRSVAAGELATKSRPPLRRTAQRAAWHCQHVEKNNEKR